jgi:glycosyltransferase involved in cell wall biosynthesis
MMVTKNMKILMIAPTPFFADRGCHVRIYEEAISLQKLGCEVVICTYHNGRDMPGLDIRRISRIPWYNKLEAGPSYHMLYLDFLLLVRSLVCMLREKPDIIHAHLHEGAFIGRLCRQIRHIPVVFDMQDSLCTEAVFYRYLRKDGLAYKFVHRIEKSIDKSADAVITSTAIMTRILVKDFGVNDNKIFPIEDGVNTSALNHNYDTAELYKQLGLPGDKQIVVYLGLLTEHQGIDLLLKAIPDIRKKVDAHFLIIGFPNIDKYQKIAQELGVSEHVTFTGRVDYEEVPKYLSLANIAVSTKLSELGGCKLYNFMACGLPTVAFDFPNNRDILGDGGIYADRADIGSLARSITELLLNEKLQHELGVKLRHRAENYSWIKVGERIAEIYNNLLSDTLSSIKTHDLLVQSDSRSVRGKVSK